VLGQGLLTDNLTREKFPTIRVSKMMKGLTYERLSPLRDEIAKIAATHNKTMAQVCLNWAICKGTIPLVGIRTSSQAKDSFGCLGWTLTPDEVASLDCHALDHSTLEKPQWKRLIFVFLISFLLFLYMMTRWIPVWSSDKKKKALKE
jgi:aryl-alcohol dehydrogenase-like predicted oxidoreductase